MRSSSTRFLMIGFVMIPLGFPLPDLVEDKLRGNDKWLLMSLLLNSKMLFLPKAAYSFKIVGLIFDAFSQQDFPLLLQLFKHRIR